MQAQRTQTSEINATQSLNLVKNLLRSGLSCITFMRGMFPIDCFKQQKISGITVHTLQPVEAEPRKLIDWIDQGCLPSVEKRYLEELIFAIYAKLDIAGEDQFYLIETYNFQIRYHENDIVMTRKSQGLEITKSIPTKQEISQATVSMIRSLITMGGTMPPLPENRAFSIKLLYRDDITPEDYQPMHFFPVQSEHQLCFFSKPESVAIGNIATAYHELNLHVLVPEESEKELAIKFSSRENTSGEVYPAYTATINNSMSPTLSDFIIPCRFKDQSTSEEIPTHGEESISSRNNHCDNSADAQTSTVPISRSQASVFDLSQKPRAIERDAFAQNEDSIQCAATKQNYENLTFAEIIEILQAVRAGTFNKIPSDIYDLSPLAAERLDQLIGMHSSEAYDELKSLYLQLDIIMFLSGGIPMRMILSHFRGTKLTRSLIREHLNELVELGIATRNKKNQVVVNKSALLQTQTPRTLVDDDAETIAPEAMFPSKDTPRGMQEQAGQTSTDCLTTRLQKHIAKGVAAFTQSDIGASQISRASPRNVTKRKISTSDSIYQILKKRKRN